MQPKSLAIVTTTINAPTEALEKFAIIAQARGWHLIIVGDKKTPEAEQRAFEQKYHSCTVYLSPEQQDELYPELSQAIGWNCIQRRNIGMVYAYRLGAEVIALVDDDNIPYEDWGTNVLVGQEVEMDNYQSNTDVFDPLSVFATPYWHRGFPIQLVRGRGAHPMGKLKTKLLVQADLWDGDPDVDAIGRIAYAPDSRFERRAHFGSMTIAPFNSQNTFLHRSCLPTYFLFPGIGRMDDIWAAYVLQHEYFACVAFAKPSVYQLRNPHNLVKDMEAEMLGYKHSLDVATKPGSVFEFLPEQALLAYQEFRKVINEWS